MHLSKQTLAVECELRWPFNCISVFWTVFSYANKHMKGHTTNWSDIDQKVVKILRPTYHFQIIVTSKSGAIFICQCVVIMIMIIINILIMILNERTQLAIDGGFQWGPQKKEH